MPRIIWGSEESKNRGLKCDEVVFFSTGSYSNYMITRVLGVVRDLSAEDFEIAALNTQLSDNGRPDDPSYRHLYEGNLIKTMIKMNMLKEIKSAELHCESLFVYEGGPSLCFDLREID